MDEKKEEECPSSADKSSCETQAHLPMNEGNIDGWNDTVDEEIKTTTEKICVVTKLSGEFKSNKDFGAAQATNMLKTVGLLRKEKENLFNDISGFQRLTGNWITHLKSETQKAIVSLEGVYQRDSQEKKELLSEMTSMNEELNRRGETISSLKEVILMYEKKVIELNSQQDCDLSTIKQLRDELTDRTQRLHDLSNQQEASSNLIYQLREELSNTSQRLQDLDNQQNDSNNTIKQLRDQLAEHKQLQSESNQKLADVNKQVAEVAAQLTTAVTARRDLEAELAKFKEHPDGDQVSTSTVSRLEESTRLKDVEDSFEDRYCKLKVVAVKLKKRATETQQLLESERQKWLTERNEFVNKLSQLNASARNNQTLQQELDRLGDELETEKKECKMLRKAATDAKSSEVGLKVKLEEASTNIEILKINLDSAIKELDKTKNMLSVKEAELESALKEKKAEELINQEKSKEILELESQLKKEQEDISNLQKTVESAKMEARNKSVLSLEIQSYEKGQLEMNAQLAAEKGKVSSLEAEMQTMQDIRDGLQTQIQLLEERVATEEKLSQQTHEQLVESRRCLQEAEYKVSQLEQTVSQLTQRLESERMSAESATLELATLSSAIQTNTDIMLKEKQDLTQQVASLSGQLASLKETFAQREEELASVRAEFDKYKVRAQSVLKKQQSASQSQAEVDAVQRAEQLTHLSDSLRAQLDQALADVERLQGELSNANVEREGAESRCMNLNIALADKTKQLERAIAEHRSQKLSLDTLVQCYKSQLEEKERGVVEQVASLTEELDGLRRQLREQVVPTMKQPTAASPPKPEPPLLEREDGEGSEYIPEYSPSYSPPPTSHKPLIPLDQLLETMDNVNDEGQTMREREREGEMAVLRGEVERSKKRAQHQAALLAEAEQDAARKEQLIAVLKKEINQLERSIQRQPHAQNTEYLKNIIFKFVTLEVGEDRLRLVPVITTLLQLSPEETQHLTATAKGQSIDLTSGWGSYFAGWR